MNEFGDRELLVVFNSCGINGDNTEVYIEHIESIVCQKDVKFDLALSNNLGGDFSRKEIERYFGRSASYIYTNENLPVLITFNYSVRKMVETYGRYDGYMYIDSGICFLESDDISCLYSLYKEKDCAMVAAEPENDTGYSGWFGSESGASVPDHEFFEIPIGKTVNLHAQIFSNEIFNSFNQRILPDIFASNCSESVFSYICASIERPFFVHRGVRPIHVMSMDGASSGFENRGLTGQAVPDLEAIEKEYANRGVSAGAYIGAHEDHMFRDYVSMAGGILPNPEAFDCGFGYEELNGIFPRNPDCYDNRGKHKDPERLRNFLAKNIYLPDSVFDYASIDGEIVPHDSFRDDHTLSNTGPDISTKFEFLEASFVKVDSELFSWNGVVPEFEREFAAWYGHQFCSLRLDGKHSIKELAENIAKHTGKGQALCSWAASAVVREAFLEAGYDLIELNVSPSQIFEISKDALLERMTSETKILIASHNWGFPGVTEEIVGVCKENDIFLFEESPDGYGGEVGHRKTGSVGDAAVLSLSSPYEHEFLGEQPVVVVTSRENLISFSYETDRLVTASFSSNDSRHHSLDQKRYEVAFDITRRLCTYPVNDGVGPTALQLTAFFALVDLKNANREHMKRSRNLARFVDGLRPDIYQRPFSVIGNSATILPIIFNKEKTYLMKCLKERLRDLSIEFAEGQNNNSISTASYELPEILYIPVDSWVSFRKIDLFLRVANSVDQLVTAPISDSYLIKLVGRVDDQVPPPSQEKKFLPRLKKHIRRLVGRKSGAR
jgi:hypothetical protein